MKNAEWILKSGINFSDVEFETGYDFINIVFDGKKIGESFIDPSHGDYSTVSAVMSWLDSEYVEPPVLTDQEKQYINAVIEPFKDRVVDIYKTDYEKNYAKTDKEQIVIGLEDDETIFLPSFKSGKYFSNMKSYHFYSLAELGLVEDKDR